LVKVNLETLFFECVDLPFFNGSTTVWSPSMKYVARVDFDENVFCRSFDPTDMTFGEDDLVSREMGELESVGDSGRCRFKPANWLPPLVSNEPNRSGACDETVCVGCVYRPKDANRGGTPPRSICKSNEFGFFETKQG
jgi:hypothetical protein